MNTNTREAIIDWGIYKNPYSEEAVLEVAGAHCEAGNVANLYERINDFKPRRTERINRKKEHGEAEYWAHKNSFELMDEGCELVVWISPPDLQGEGTYFEGRINFMITNDGKFNGWGIPAMRSGEKLVELARKLEEIGGMSMDGFESVEQLRQQPIGFKKFDEQLKKQLEDIFGLDGFWKYVNGEQKVKKAEVVKATRECLEISGGNNTIYFREMERRGYKLMVISDHGAGGSALTNNFGVSKFQLMRNGEVKVERTNGKMVCPCGEVLREGATTCPRCGLKLVTD